jgi:hypothetical protein
VLNVLAGLVVAYLVIVALVLAASLVMHALATVVIELKAFWRELRA